MLTSRAEEFLLLLEGDLLFGLPELEPQVVRVLVGQGDVELICLREVPEDLLGSLLALLLECIVRSLIPPLNYRDSVYSRFLGKLPSCSGMVIGIPLFDVALWETPVTLGVLQKQDAVEVYEDEAAGCLHTPFDRVAHILSVLRPWMKTLRGQGSLQRNHH